MAAAAAAAVLALPAAVSAGPVAQWHDNLPATASGPAAGHLGTVPRYVPLARTLSGSGTLALAIAAVDGQPEASADVIWGVQTSTDFASGEGTTDSGGLVNLPGAPAADANGEIVVLPAGDYLYDLSGLTWPAEGLTATVQPGQMPVTILRSTSSTFNTWSQAEIDLTANEANGSFAASTWVAPSGDVTTGYAKTMSAPGAAATLDEGTVWFWPNEGLELAVGGTPVAPGSTTDPFVVDENLAHAVWMNHWASGKPGTKDYLVFERFPAGWVNTVTGWAGYPATAKPKTFGTWTVPSDRWGKKITIPASATPGYDYVLEVDHQGGTLSLQTGFQVCTLNASRLSIHRGAAVTLSGIVPIKNHFGAHKGKASKVILYKTTSATAGKSQPNKAGGPHKIGHWTKVAAFKTNRVGKFVRRSQKPSHTTWYVLWYPKVSGEYWGAWTSPRQVKVR
jgi:hypothetical protein